MFETVLVANRGAERAQRLAKMHGVGVVDLGEIPAALSTVDLVVCATASPESARLRKADIASAVSTSGLCRPYGPFALSPRAWYGTPRREPAYRRGSLPDGR